jgi:hypothetical protein
VRCRRAGLRVAGLVLLLWLVPPVATTRAQTATIPPSCRTMDVAISASRTGIMQTSSEFITVTNVGIAACAIRGYGAVYILDGMGTTLQLDYSYGPHFVNGEATVWPDPAVGWILQPGQQSSAFWSWANWCEPIPPGPLRWRFGLPGDFTTAYAAEGGPVSVPPCTTPDPLHQSPHVLGAFGEGDNQGLTSFVTASFTAALAPVGAASPCRAPAIGPEGVPQPPQPYPPPMPEGASAMRLRGSGFQPGETVTFGDITTGRSPPELRIAQRDVLPIGDTTASPSGTVDCVAWLVFSVAPTYLVVAAFAYDLNNESPGERPLALLNVPTLPTTGSAGAIGSVRPSAVRSLLLLALLLWGLATGASCLNRRVHRGDDSEPRQ